MGIHYMNTYFFSYANFMYFALYEVYLLMAIVLLVYFETILFILVITIGVYKYASKNSYLLIVATFKLFFFAICMYVYTYCSRIFQLSLSPLIRKA